jgi:molybdopterin converting factor small subunit
MIRIPTPLRPYTGGISEVPVAGATVAETLADLTTQYPTLRPHLFNEAGQLRPFVNIFRGADNIRDLQGVDTPVQAGEQLRLIPSIAGGAS